MIASALPDLNLLLISSLLVTLCTLLLKDGNIRKVVKIKVYKSMCQQTQNLFQGKSCPSALV
jgi:hypothetical protein